MAFDLVQYFVEQIEKQKPSLFSEQSTIERRHTITVVNALTLGKLISNWRLNAKETYRDMSVADELFIQEIARHLSTSPHNQLTLSHSEQVQAISEVFQLQLAELKQLNDTAQLKQQGIHELLLGQIEYLSGSAEDWVWSTNNLTELLGSKPMVEETVSLDETMKEFHSMVNQQQDTHVDIQIDSPVVPSWSKVIEPIVALAILWFLANAACQLFV